VEIAKWQKLSSGKETFIEPIRNGVSAPLNDH
jgi:hypothetical protein